MSARLGIAKLLRAPWNFEEDYDGQPGDVPILFTAPFTSSPLPAGTPDTYTALDQEAQQSPPPPGISPLLAKMVSVPIGSTLAIYFPVIQRPIVKEGDTQDPPIGYVWRATFRLRTIADFQRRKKSRVPWSIPLSRFGTHDTRTGSPPNRPGIFVAGPRVIKTASSESVIYNRSKPEASATPPFFGTLSTDASVIPFGTTTVTRSPFYPGWSNANPIQNLDYEQGERDPATLVHGLFTSPYRTGPFHVSRFLKCMGNEFSVECFKYELSSYNGAIVQPRAWDFGFSAGKVSPNAEDFYFSLLLGVGARALEGATPPLDTGVRFIAGTFPQ